MPESHAEHGRVWWRYALALPLFILALIFGNLAGIIFTAVMGFHAMAHDKPGGVILSGAQIFFGIIGGFAGSEKFLKDSFYVYPWLILLILLSAVGICGILVLALYNNRLGSLGWGFASDLSALVVMEICRRGFNEGHLGGRR